MSDRCKSAAWKRLRLRVLRAHNWTCSRCGKPSLKLDVHHKDFDPTNDNEDNLVPLCRGKRSCHWLVHQHRFRPKLSCVMEVYKRLYPGDFA